ncbi:hypothetical protein MLAC_09240 [Mycobacterium lacus]|uniref:Uncharacterized protein n=1 Tax=Mycobacterium lacus TaxID=169765 RepID=A0A7I7NGE6_9MYCO|nr:hypothetical protein MLAC_09240 [Mycobacterium lacus]
MPTLALGGFGGQPELVWYRDVHGAPRPIALACSTVYVVEDIVDNEIGTGLVIVTNELDPARLWMVGPAIATENEGMVAGADKYGIA